MSFYYLGLNKKTIQNNNFFKKAIVVSGGNKNDYCYENIFNKTIDYNDIENSSELIDFYDDMIFKINKEENDAKFILYNQASIEEMCNVENVICVNDIDLIKLLNDKQKCRELLSDEISVLDYKYLKANDIDYLTVSNIFGNAFNKYVVQQPVGFAGVGTYLLDKNENILNFLKDDITYSISGYIENSISLNNTFIISDTTICVFDGSYQCIDAGEELKYNGWDFNSYDKLSSKLKSKIYEQTIKIAKKLQQLGYRGICGVDYILKDENLYFMEINPRFQASSERLDKILQDKGLPSLFELNYMAFYNEKSFIKACEIKEKVL